MDQQSPYKRIIIIVLTCATFALGGLGLFMEAQVRAGAILLLTLVILGTAYDFLGANMGGYVQNRGVLLFFTRTRFSLLNFGIIFTPMAAAFVLAKLASPSLCTRLVDTYPYWLVFSLVTGALFMFTKYDPAEEDGMPTYKLDRSHGFTSFAFIIRRVILLCSLVIALITMYEGVQTDMALWTLLFGGLFIATIPLHILHKELLSMAAEFATLVVLLYGTWVVYMV